MINDDLYGECRALTYFFQIAITCTAANAPSSLEWTNLPTGSRSDIVLEKRDRLLRIFFPLLDQNLAAAQQSGIATAIGNLDLNLMQIRQEDELRRMSKENKTVEG